MRVVLDTNFWVSALMYSRESSILHQIQEQFLEGGFELVTSPELVEEFAELCVRHSITKSVMEHYLGLMHHSRTETPPFVHHVEPTDLIDAISADPDNNRILECAVAGQADCIVSGDKHLLKLSSYQNIPILSPRDFILKLNSEE